MENGVDYYIFLLQISDAITYLAKIHINLWDPQKGPQGAKKVQNLSKNLKTPLKTIYKLIFDIFEKIDF